MLSRQDLHDFLDAAFAGATETYEVTSVTAEGVTIRYHVTSQHGRPGGTVSGPTMMALSDTAAWLALVAQIGREAMAVTTSLHIDFLRKPELEDLIAEAILLKLGRQLAVIEVAMRSSSKPTEIVAKAQVTYSIPPKRTDYTIQ